MGELRHPSYLSLWMSKHGRPDQIRVDFRQTASGAVSWVILAVTTKHDAGSIEVQSAEIGQNRFDPEHDVYLAIKPLQHSRLDRLRSKVPGRVGQ